MTDLFNQDVDKGAAKYDAGKPRMDLLPFESLTAVASVFTFGAEKYDDWNWMKGEGLDPDRLLAAALRHIAAHQRDPKQVDRESMLPHYWHATTYVNDDSDYYAARGYVSRRWSRDCR